jgi:hypothetical protein
MQAMPVSTWIEQLPPGPERSERETLAKRIDQSAWVVWVPYSQEPMWLVSGKLHAQALRLSGVPPSHVWTLATLRDFFAACGSDVKTLEEAARLFTSNPPDESV